MLALIVVLNVAFEPAFLVGPEASRTDACPSVDAVLRQSYFLVIDLQSKAA